MASARREDVEDLEVEFCKLRALQRIEDGGDWCEHTAEPFHCAVKLIDLCCLRSLEGEACKIVAL